MISFFIFLNSQPDDGCVVQPKRVVFKITTISCCEGRDCFTVYVTIQVNKRVWVGGSGTELLWLRIGTGARALVNAGMNLPVP
jgi:hypothetical protein